MFTLPTLHKRSFPRLTLQSGGYDLGKKTDALKTYVYFLVLVFVLDTPETHCCMLLFHLIVAELKM